MIAVPVNMLPVLLMIGSLVGVLIVFDPYITIILNPLVSLKHFPYEVTFLVSIFSIFLLFYRQLIRGFRVIINNMEKYFIFLYLFGQATISLHVNSRLDLSELTLMFFLAVFFMKMVMNKSEKFIISKIDLMNLAFIIVVAISAFNGGLGTFFSSIFTVVKFFLIAFLFANVIYRKELLHLFLQYFFLMVFVSSIIGILQEILYRTLKVMLVGSFNIADVNLMLEFTSSGVFLRVPAFFETYRTFDLYLIPGLLFLVNYFIYKKTTDLKEKFFLAISFLTMFSALVLTFSKDGMLSFMATLILSIIIRWPRLIVHLFVAVICISLALISTGIGGDILDTVFAEFSMGEIRIRTILLKEGIQGYFRHPWIGVGCGEGDKYTSNYFGWPTHHGLVQAADEIGLIGLLVYLLLIAYTFYNLVWLNIVVRNRNSETGVVRGLFIGYISFLITIQFHPFFIEKFFWLYMGVVQGAVLLYAKKGYSDNSRLFSLNPFFFLKMLKSD